MNNSYISLIASNDSTAFNTLHQTNLDTKIALKNEIFSHLYITHFNLVNIDFSGTVFQDCYFKYVNFWASDFSGVRFENCFLISCCFGTPELINVDMEAIKAFVFQPALFSNTQFTNTKFLNTTFRETDLQNTLFDNCTIEKSDFRYANLQQTSTHQSNWLNNLQ